MSVLPASWGAKITLQTVLETLYELFSQRGTFGSQYLAMVKHAKFKDHIQWVFNILLDTPETRARGSYIIRVFIKVLMTSA